MVGEGWLTHGESVRGVVLSCNVVCLLRMICAREERVSHGRHEALRQQAHWQTGVQGNSAGGPNVPRVVPLAHAALGSMAKPLAGGDEGGSRRYKDVRIDESDQRQTLRDGVLLPRAVMGRECKLLVVWPARIQERGLPGTCRGPSWAKRDPAAQFQPPQTLSRRLLLDYAAISLALALASILPMHLASVSMPTTTVV